MAQDSDRRTNVSGLRTKTDLDFARLAAIAGHGSALALFGGHTSAFGLARLERTCGTGDGGATERGLILWGRHCDRGGIVMLVVLNRRRGRERGIRTVFLCVRIYWRRRHHRMVGTVHCLHPPGGDWLLNGKRVSARGCLTIFAICASSQWAFVCKPNRGCANAPNYQGQLQPHVANPNGWS
jgi:hypothetical protein